MFVPGVVNGDGDFLSVNHGPVELDGEPPVAMSEWKGLRRPTLDPVDRERLGVERASRDLVAKRGHADRRLSTEGSGLFLEAQLDAVVQDVEVARALLAERAGVDVDLLRRERGREQKELHSGTGARFWTMPSSLISASISSIVSGMKSVKFSTPSSVTTTVSSMRT